LLQSLEGFGARSHVRNLYAFARKQLSDAVTLTLIVLHHEHPADVLLKLRLEPLEGRHQLLALYWFQRITHGPETERLLAEVRDRHHMHGNVARARVALQLVQDLQTGAIREVHIENDRVHFEFLGRRQRVAAGVSGDA
jgi:hypothetical protein